MAFDIHVTKCEDCPFCEYQIYSVVCTESWDYERQEYDIRIKNPNIIHPYCERNKK